jgi:murein DD-endopeptidase MepM/ murein hydrolase activator NlpD
MMTRGDLKADFDVFWQHSLPLRAHLNTEEQTTVLKFKAAWAYTCATISRIFPEHHVVVESGGKTRRLRLSTRMQLIAASTSLLFASWMIGSLGSDLLGLSSSTGQTDELAQREAQLNALRGRMLALNADVRDLQGEVRLAALRLEQRHHFLSQLLNNRLHVNTTTAAPLSVQQKMDLARAELALHQAPSVQGLAPYQALAQEQSSFTLKALHATQARYETLKGLVHRLGLSSDGLMAGSMAVGGPLVRASFERGAYSALEPQYKDLYMSWTRLDLLQRAMLSIPAFIPTRNFTFTSGFGVRYDPFNGGTAMHAGIDMAGPLGTPIMAAASGVVTKAQWLGGYGNLVEIDHGRGLSTRYGHLHTLDVREGDRVEQGQVVGTMGSTGRSTGVHLHYEIRVNGEAVNPMPFLEAARDVLDVQRMVDNGAPLPDQAG